MVCEICFISVCSILCLMWLKDINLSQLTHRVVFCFCISRTAGLPQYGQLGHGTDNEVIEDILFSLSCIISIEFDHDRLTLLHSTWLWMLDMVVQQNLVLMTWLYIYGFYVS